MPATVFISPPSTLSNYLIQISYKLSHLDTIGYMVEPTLFLNNFVSHPEEIMWVKGIWEQGIEENSWNSERESNMRIEKIT
jgi:hypothetical protein